MVDFTAAERKLQSRISKVEKKIEILRAKDEEKQRSDDRDNGLSRSEQSRVRGLRLSLTECVQIWRIKWKLSRFVVDSTDETNGGFEEPISGTPGLQEDLELY